MTSPSSEERRVRLLAVTACPTGIGHTSMAAAKNMLGGTVAGALAGMAGVTDAVPHGGPWPSARWSPPSR
ncbi:hypothetical protein [Streptomyces sp. NPDC048350]|uniref:hypothetical protein n=1 Tax=Streptomyces sp. NPDC048350 TaxID=3365538 RepID=UPI0037141BE9